MEALSKQHYYFLVLQAWWSHVKKKF